MSHVRKDSSVAPEGWEKHLRPFSKRKLSKRERLAAKTKIKKDIDSSH